MISILKPRSLKVYLLVSFLLLVAPDAALAMHIWSVSAMVFSHVRQTRVYREVLRVFRLSCDLYPGFPRRNSSL
jgi:hypothetical protein